MKKDSFDLIQRKVPLGPYTTLGVGGPAEYFALVEDMDDLNAVMAFADEVELPIYMLGGGSKLLVSDFGVDGLVIKLSGQFCEISREGNSIIVGAGVGLGALCIWTLQNGLSGLEGCIGIPGKVGGAIAGNAGTPMGAVSDCITQVRIFDRKHGFRNVAKGECGFEYRNSCLHPEIILGASFELRQSSAVEVRAKMLEVLSKRRNQPKGRSAGCTFKNPPQGPAGRILDSIGAKAFSCGCAQVAKEHANFIINAGASASEVFSVVKRCVQTVRDHTSILLEPEIHLWGFERESLEDAMDATNHSKKIAVFCGGVSSERDISLESGHNVAEGLRKAHYRVDLIDCDKAFFENVPPLDCDAVFLALHGVYGEDGYIQHILEQRGIPFTGSGSRASELGMDKVASKRLFAVAGLSVPPGAVLSRKQTEIPGRMLESLGFPLVIKPSRQGSTIGMSVAHDTTELKAGIDKAFEFDDVVLVEKFIKGREFTAAVMENKVLPLIFVRPKHEIFDFQCKYGDNLTDFLFDHDLSARQVYDVERVALKAYRCIGCAGIARVDIIHTDDGRDYVLEINTIPGMTAHSLVPKAANRIGISFPALCDLAIKMAVRPNAKTRVAI